MLKHFMKMVLRNKTNLLWGLIFPIALMSLFKLTFSNISSSENTLDTRKIAVVLDGSGIYQENFKTVMDELSKQDSEDGLTVEVSYTDEKEASAGLDNGDYDFYYVVGDEDITVHLGEKYGVATGMIAREIADTYKFNMDIINECLKTDPAKIGEITESLGNRLDYIAMEKEEEADVYMWYYVSTLVMGILFDYALGLRVLATVRADVAGSAMRVALSSSSKTRMVVYCLFAQLVSSLAKTAVHLLFMQFVIGIDIASKAGIIAIAIVATTVFSICLGILLGMFFKGDVQSRENKTLGFVMLSVFISGEMIVSLPGYIEKYAPVINRINPATIFNKIFYRILLCENKGDLAMNLLILTIASLVMLTASIIILRRETYASL
ncbi:MAG: ABC transporter permease [Clostridiales bacterium]|nr:ABC transporter permease [Clostridiales bacterium]